MENHDSMLLGWYPSTPAYPPVDLPPGPQGPSTSNLVRLPPGDYPDLRTPIIHPHEPGDPAPATSGAVTTVHQSVSCAPSDRVMTSATHAVHLSHIVQPHVTQVTHLNAQIAQPQVLQQMVTSAGVTSGGHTLVQMVGVPAGSVAGNVNLPIGGTLQTTQGSLIHVIEAPIEGPPFRCSECDHVAKTKRMLKRHLATVHSQERNYACQYCDAKFKLSGHLNEHLAGKHNIGKCTCDKCGKLFSTPFRLKQHTLLAHEDFRLECPYENCDYKTKYQQQLNKHVKCKHLGLDPQAATGKRKCSLCDFEGYCLAAHVRAVHTKEKPYKCQHCDRAFSDRNNQRAHEHRVHAKDRLRHKCDYCDQTFYTPGRLREHIAVRHTHEHTHLCENCGFSTAVERTYLRHRKSNCNYHKTPLECNRCDFTTHIPFQFKSHKETCEATGDEDLKKLPTRRKVKEPIDVAEVQWKEGVDGRPRKASKKALKVRISLPARKRATATAKPKKQRIVWTSSEEDEEAVDYSVESASIATGIQDDMKPEDSKEESQPVDQSPRPAEGVVLADEVDDIKRHLKQQKLKKQAIERSIRNIKKQSRISSKKRKPIRGHRRKIYTEDSDSDYEPDQIKQPVLERRESSRRIKVPAPEFVEMVDVPNFDHSEVCTEAQAGNSAQSPLAPAPESPGEVTIDAEEIEVFACTQCQTFFIDKSKLAEHIMEAHVSKVKIKVNSDEWTRGSLTF